MSLRGAKARRENFRPPRRLTPAGAPAGRQRRNVFQQTGIIPAAPWENHSTALHMTDFRACNACYSSSGV